MKKNILLMFFGVLIFTLVGCSQPKDDTSKTVNSRQEDSEVRIIKADNGEVEIPANPKRILVLDWAIVGDVIPFETNLVGIEDYFEQYAEFDKWDASWSKQMQGIEYLDRDNIESILEMDPDLIITSSYFEDTISKYSKVAPTIAVDIRKMSLEESLKFFGEVFGMEDRAKDLINQYHKQIETAKSRLEDASLLDKRIAFVQGIEGKEVHVHGDLNRALIYKELGMQAPKIIEENVFSSSKAEGFAEKISLEVLPQYLADADIIGYTKFDDVESLKKELAKVSLWNDIQAVKENNVFYFDFDSSIIGYDYISKMVALDDFVSQLIDLPIAKN